MGISINIDETIRKPNVRPPAPVSKRGPITFFVDIEESNGRDLRRNLTRGVDETDDTPVPVPPPTDRSIALQTLLLSLSVASEFPLNIEIPLSSVSVELTNLIELNNGLVVTDDEFLALTNEAEFISPKEAALSSVIVELSVSTIGVQTTGNVQRDLGVVEVALTAQEPSITEGISVDSVVTDLTVDIEVDATTVFEPVVVDLSVDIATDGANNVSLDVIEVELGSNLGVEAVTDAELSVDLSVEAPRITRGIGVDTASVELTLEEFELEVGGELDIPGVSLTVDPIETETSNNSSLDAVNVDLSLTESFDNAVNLKLPDNMVSTPDDASPIP